MRRKHIIARVRVPVFIASVIAVCAVGGFSLARAQTDPSKPEYPLILTGERALALVQAADQKLHYIPGEVIVKFKNGVTALGQDRALQALRSRPLSTDLRWLGEVALLRDASEPDARILAAQLSSQPEVAYAQPNYIRRFNRTPADGSYSKQWNLSAIDMPRAWDINPGGKDTIIVAVVDTGITTVNQPFTFATWNGRDIQNIFVPYATNPDLAASRLVSPRDFAFWTGPVLDMVGHGTHVSSTIGEDSNTLAETGIAYNVKIMPVKACVGHWEIQFALAASGYRGFVPADAGGCDTADVAQGIRYAADNGAKVINLSLGGPESSQVEIDALNYAIGKGVFIAVSAGNAFEEGNPVEYPAAHAANINGAISVGAVGPSLTRAWYSNTGPYVEIVAPGGNDRDGGDAAFVWQATLNFLDSDPESVIFPRFDRYAEVGYEGTSMAAPHVAGTAALLISQGITNPAAVEAVLKRTARDLGQRGRDDQFGFGLIQPRTALFGFGLAR